MVGDVCKVCVCGCRNVGVFVDVAGWLVAERELAGAWRSGGAGVVLNMCLVVIDDDLCFGLIFGVSNCGGRFGQDRRLVEGSRACVFVGVLGRR